MRHVSKSSLVWRRPNGRSGRPGAHSLIRRRSRSTDTRHDRLSYRGRWRGGPVDLYDEAAAMTATRAGCEDRGDVPEVSSPGVDSARRQLGCLARGGYFARRRPARWVADPLSHPATIARRSSRERSDQIGAPAHDSGSPDGGVCSAAAVGFGGLIQTSVGAGGGTGGRRTNRSGWSS